MEVVSLECFERAKPPGVVTTLIDGGSYWTHEILKHRHLILASFMNPILVKFLMGVQ